MKWWVESDVKTPNLPLSLRFKGSTLTDSPFLASSQLTTSIRWSCSCTVLVYVVIHFCDSMWSVRVDANMCRLFNSLFISNYQEGVTGRCNTTTSLCMSQTRTRDFHRYMSWSFRVQWLKARCCRQGRLNSIIDPRQNSTLGPYLHNHSQE
jgi:hypothetical protein